MIAYKAKIEGTNLLTGTSVPLERLLPEYDMDPGRCRLLFSDKGSGSAAGSVGRICPTLYAGKILPTSGFRNPKF